MMKITRIVMIGATLLILAYDAFALWQGGLESTISFQFVKLSHDFPFLPFLLGMLAGHLTTQMKV